MRKDYSLDPNEAYVIDLLRGIKDANNREGHGKLVVEVQRGVETFIRPEYSFMAPLKK